MFKPDSRLYNPAPDSHKGQNGKLLVIGGSELFHSSIFWAADIASRIVDIVHLTSPANENNLVFRRHLKEKFWSGIVVDWKDVESYIAEDDAVLIGPGMIRRQADQGPRAKGQGPKEAAEKDDTKQIVNYLLKKYSAKRWVIDGGGLQEVKPELITESCILTPHRKEFDQFRLPNLSSLSKSLDNCTILLKGSTDTICRGDRCVEIKGGNPGMTKGGTGDVLAGLVAALYCKNDSWIATTVGSWVNKKAGDDLYKKAGPYLNAADLIAEIPKILAKFAKPVASREVSQTSREV
jgi:NAD(P)H-hydrate epimerase